MSKLIAAAWRLLDAITSPATVLALLLLSAALFAGGVERHLRLQAARADLNAAQLQLAKAGQAYAEARADASDKARLVGATYRAAEQRMQQVKDQAEADHAANRKAAEARAAALAADNRQLRQLAEQYAAGAGGAAGGADDSLAACRRRAATLGQLFAEADAEAGAMAGAAEKHADELRLMLQAWPRNAPEAAATQ